MNTKELIIISALSAATAGSLAIAAWSVAHSAHQTEQIEACQEVADAYVAAEADTFTVSDAAVSALDKITLSMYPDLTAEIEAVNDVTDNIIERSETIPAQYEMCKGD